VRTKAIRRAVVAASLGWCADAVAAPPSSDAVESASDAPAEGLPEGLVMPRLLSQFDIVYPSELAAAESPPSGRVVVEYVVGVDGRASEIQVIQAVDPTLDALAVQAIEDAVFSAGTFEDEAVEIATSSFFDFEPPAPEPPAETGASDQTDGGDRVDGTSDPDGTSGADEAEEGSEPPDGEAAVVRIRGRLLEAGQRTTVEGATVVAISGEGLDEGRVRPRASRKWLEGRGDPEWSVEARTDAEGRFELAGVPDGRVLLVFVTTGYERLEWAVQLDPDTELDGTYYQTRENTNPYRTVVEADRERAAEVVRRTIALEEVEKIPGTQGDTLKGLQNFPGLARTPFGIGLLVIRGAAPGDSAVYLGGHEIPQLFHFGGVASVYNSGLIADLSYIPSNFGGEFGDATGGVVDIRPASPRRDGFHGYAQVDLLGASALAQGKLGEGGFAVALRRSYIDAITPRNVGVTLLPRYWDYQGTLEYPVAKGKGRLTLRALGSDDRYVALDPIAEGFDLNQWFHRGDLEYQHDFGDGWSMLVTPSFLYQYQNDLANEQTEYRWSLRAEARRRVGRRFSWAVGTETRAGFADLDLIRAQLDPFGPPNSVGEDSRSDNRVTFATPALYARTTMQAGTERPVTISPSVRGTWYAMPADQATVDPRVNAEWQVADQWKIRGGVGAYSQSPTLTELDEVFGNPGLRPERSMQASAGFAVGLPASLSLELTGFYKSLYDLAVPSDRLVDDADGNPTPIRFENTGTGRAFGGELLFRRDFSQKFYGWVAYTLSRAELRNRPQDELAVAPFDQTHILTLVAGYKLPKNWTLGARFRLVSGLPYTPLANGIYDAGSGTWLPLPSPENSARLAPFNQLDLRVDKTWSFRLTRLMAYLDVQNVYNAKNPEFQVYSYDFEDAAQITSLPLLPTIGVRLDW
jgi:hypothetical protein